MKYFRPFATVALLIGIVFATSGMSAPSRHDTAHAVLVNVDIVLQNKCTRDVKYQSTLAGQSSQGTIPKGDKVRLSLGIGTTIKVDGEDFMTVAAADNGQTFQACR